MTPDSLYTNNITHECCDNELAKKVHQYQLLLTTSKIFKSTTKNIDFFLLFQIQIRYPTLAKSERAGWRLFVQLDKLWTGFAVIGFLPNYSHRNKTEHTIPCPGRAWGLFHCNYCPFSLIISESIFYTVRCRQSGHEDYWLIQQGVSLMRKPLTSLYIAPPLIGAPLFPVFAKKLRHTTLFVLIFVLFQALD